MPIFITRDFSRLTLGQKITAIAALIAAFVLAAVLGLVMLYIAAVVIALGFIAAVGYSIYRRFFAPKPQVREGMTIYRTREGIIIDVEQEDEEEKR